MKKIICGMLGLLGTVVFSQSAETVPAGTYDNLLANGKLELYAGNFPGSWRYVGTEPGYLSTGGFNNGGRFIFAGDGKTFLIRQDWSFTLVEGEQYYLRAKVRTRNFRAGRSALTVFNNGWKKEFSIVFPSGTSDWKTIEQTFTGMESDTGYYSIAVQVSKIVSGELEISDITLEPATERAFERSTEYLRLIPVPTLVVLGRQNRIPASDAVLNCRWFGDKKATSIRYSAGSLQREAKINAGGIVSMDFSGLQPGKYEVKAEAGGKTISFPVELLPGFPSVKGKVLNNFHTVIAEQQVSAGGSGSFVNPRDGWVLFRMPEDMILRIDGMKKAVRDGHSVRLPMGAVRFKAEKGTGTVKISAVTEISIYPLAGGPYLSGLPKHDWAFTKKYELPMVMTFLGGGLKGAEMSQFRAGHQKFYGHAPVGTVIRSKEGQELKFPGLNPNFTWFDGIFLDELALSMQRTQVLFLKNLEKMKIPAGRDVHTYICGNFPDTPYAAEVFSRCINLSPGGKVIAERYLPNTYTSETKAAEQVQELVRYAENLNRVCPSVNPYWGLSLCHSNVATSFTVDNEPEADHRVLLDMQMQTIATHPAFKEIGLINFWGDNYADRERTRWVMELLRHYVIEGKTSLLSAEKGMKLCPGHLRNASFRDGLKEWQTEGSVQSGRSPEGGKFLKRFNAQTDSSMMLVLTRGAQTARVTQEIKMLTPGKNYKIRLVTSGKGALSVKLDGKLISPVRQVVRTADAKRKVFPCRYEEYIFRAERNTASLELNNESQPAGTKTNLHYISVFSCYGDEK